ncbi:MAG: hypothetical protein RLZZ613_1490 [Pseudomonadota bacterium]|jgi:hypothetical protein
MEGSMSGKLSIPDLELIYDELAQAIDSLEPNKQTLFLVKLVLLNANELGDADLVRAHIQASLKDL